MYFLILILRKRVFVLCEVCEVCELKSPEEIGGDKTSHGGNCVRSLAALCGL